MAKIATWAMGAVLLAAMTPSLAPAQATAVQAGEWEIAVTVDSIDMPNAPPAVVNMMRGKTTKVSHCLTPEEAARGPQDLLKTSKSCTFNRYSMQDGKLDSEIVCKMGDGEMVAQASGSFNATSFSAAGRSVATGPMPMTMTSTSVGRRIGDCGS